MKYLYYFLLTLVVAAGLYTVFGIFYFKWVYFQVENPKAEFQIDEVKGYNRIQVVDFTNYQCAFCKAVYKNMVEAKKLNATIEHIVRPISFPQPEDPALQQKPAPLENLVLAAGMQGKFWEMHTAFMDYPHAVMPEDVLEETANLYGVDYNKMVRDARGKKVAKYLKDNLHDMQILNLQAIPSYIIGKRVYLFDMVLPETKDLIAIFEKEKHQ